ncbi:hypothetical protein DRF58_02475 [Epilithonimonas hispanica]|uniref:Uncharacterized protein n=2 Tax=Epilithonimonas hispanica TaxID=358687 RepID=A0A3D9D3I0_9FLAO|nr:hypothetical protein DRF58_02475 [Epilithonimonas hispanica]
MLIFQFFNSYAQEVNIDYCNLKYEIDTVGLSKTGILRLNITNNELVKLKISDEFSEVRIQPINVEKFEKNLNQFDKIPKSIIDVNCLNCFGKFKNVKPNTTISYSININDSKFFKEILTQAKATYRFNIWFDTIDMIKYSKSKKCFSRSFTSDKIIYKKN